MNRCTIGTIPPSSTTNPKLSAYALSNRAGHDPTMRRFVASSSKRMRATASGPAMRSSALSSSRTVAVKPGRQTTRVCAAKAEAGTDRARIKLRTVVSGLASQSASASSAGEVRLSPMGHVVSAPWRGSRMIATGNRCQCRSVRV